MTMPFFKKIYKINIKTETLKFEPVNLIINFTFKYLKKVINLFFQFLHYCD